VTDQISTRTLSARQLDDAVNALMAEAGVTANRSLVRRIVRTGIRLGEDNTSRLDMKMSAAAIEEMRAAYATFAPYADTKKITVFGSARTQPFDPLYKEARAVASQMARHGWMVVTGAGPGIMEAAADGAGEDLSIGVSIRLPFEEAPDALVQQNPKHVTMKYFFTRKLMLMKESSGFVCLPGGFGTLDETFELLTLQQTGKAEPVPIVLLDRPGGTYWRSLKDYVTSELAGLGMISADDMDRVLITHSVDEAVHEIFSFWHNYDSLRWVDHELIFRLKHRPELHEIAQLNRRFGKLLEHGTFESAEPREPEIRDDDKLDLPRISFVPKPRSVGSLYRIIRAINGFRSAGPSDRSHKSER
jgi:uncharacterized protein (TIGR00730 family)